MTRHQTRRCVAVCCLLIACSAPVADRDLTYHRGLTALYEGRADLAVEYFTADLDTDPRRAESIRGLATAWLAMAHPRLGDAARGLERYLALRPDDAEAQLMLVQTLFRSGAWEKARERLPLLDQSPAAHQWRVRVLLDGDLDAAATAATRALDLHADDPGLLELAAEIEIRKGRPDRATELAERAVGLGSTRPGLYYLLSRLSRMAGQDDRVADLVQVHEHLERLARAQDPGQLPPAVRLELLDGLDGRLPAASFWLRVQRTLALIESRAVPEATAELERLRAEPELTDATRVQLASFALSAGMNSWASRLYEDVDEHGAHARSALDGLAQLALSAGRFAEVERLARAGLEREPHIGRYHYLLAVALIGMERLEQAEPLISRALELAPWHDEWRLSLPSPQRPR